MAGPNWTVPGLDAAWCAAPVLADSLSGRLVEQPVSPASVLKLPIALAAEAAIAAGDVDGMARVTLRPEHRTSGPVGMSLMADPVEMSVRDLVVPMLTISDNVATDALLKVVGVDRINSFTTALGLPLTAVTGDLAMTLDGVARDCGFSGYPQLAAHDPAVDGPPSESDLRAAIYMSAALDPGRGWRTTPAEMVALLRSVWRDEAAAPDVCARVRSLLGRQLTRNRIASGFGPGWAVAAKSGGLLGVVRNEVGVITAPDGESFAVAIFTRRQPDATPDPARTDAAIGRLARELVESLRRAR
ncbi:serine hydrolase [Flexivirga caeni]|uniref:Serine hydrolase n=1 Tax=Flexivirga caeni TaxID=2294115 RepID=A0A3M9M7X4_9MICO|nr:serine hydrolase [Flexivirga caeni]RNI21669.1 serine hydrolase [Flexivirga caeni]